MYAFSRQSVGAASYKWRIWHMRANVRWILTCATSSCQHLGLSSTVYGVGYQGIISILTAAAAQKWVQWCACICACANAVFLLTCATSSCQHLGLSSMVYGVGTKVSTPCSLWCLVCGSFSFDASLSTGKSMPIRERHIFSGGITLYVHHLH